MSRKRCKRVIRPKVNPIALAIEGACVSAKSLLDQLRLLELSALEAFRTGAATSDDWRTVADVLNVAETFVSMGIGPEAASACHQVEQALLAAHGRYQAGMGLTLAGPELQAMRELHGWYDAQRMAVGRSVYEIALTKTRNRIRSAHPSVKEMGA